MEKAGTGAAFLGYHVEPLWPVSSLEEAYRRGLFSDPVFLKVYEQHARRQCTRVEGERYCIHGYRKLLKPAAFYRLPVLFHSRGHIVETESARQVSYPFPKFFNLGETPHATWRPGAPVVTEKLDGVLVQCFATPGLGVKCTTRGALWNQGAGYTSCPPDETCNPFARSLVDFLRKTGQWSEAESLASRGTLLFELILPVEPHRVRDVEEQARLAEKPRGAALIALGTPRGPEYRVDAGLPRPSFYHVNSPEEARSLAESRDWEGIVAHWPGEPHAPGAPGVPHLVKVKRARWHLEVNRSWRKIARAVLRGRADDLLPHLTPEEREFAEALIQAVARLEDAAEKAGVSPEQAKRFLEKSLSPKKDRIIHQATRLAEALEKGRIPRTLRGRER